MSLRQLFFYLSLLLGTAGAARAQTVAAGVDVNTNLKGGVFVETVRRNSGADQAGIHAGDVIVGWSRNDQRRRIESPFDFAEVEVEQGGREIVVLDGTRGTEHLTWTVQAGFWDLNTRPNLAGELLTLQQKSTETGGEEKWAAEVIGLFGAEAKTDTPRSLRAWFLLRSAELLAKAKQWDKADDACRQAVQQLSANGPSLTAQLLKRCADALLQEGGAARSEKYYEEAVSASEAANSGLTTAAILSSWARLAFTKDDLARDEDLLHRAIAIQRELAPASLVLAFNLNRLGVYFQSSGKLNQSAQYIEEALAIRETLLPASTVLAATLQNLGDTFTMLGDLDESQQFLIRARDLWEKLDPEGRSFAASLIDLSTAVVARGDLAQGELLLRRAMAIQSKLRPDSPPAPALLNQLGLILQHRGQLAEAEGLFKQGLTAMAPGSLDAAVYMDNLGEVARDRGDLADAEKWLTQVIAIREQAAPESLELGETYSAMGDAKVRKGNLAGAEEHYRRALAIEEKAGSRGPDRVDTLKMLGDIAVKRGDYAAAETSYQNALRVEQGGSWTSPQYVAAVLALADLKYKEGQLGAARDLFGQGLAMLEKETTNIGGNENVRSGFRATFNSYYRDYIDLLIREKQPELAFEVLERSRARSLLEMLLEAHIDIHQGVDSGLLELERRLRCEIRAKSNRRLSLLTQEHTKEQTAAVTKEIEDLVVRYQDVEGQIRGSSPIYAALTQPRPLSSRQVQEQLLDSDTMLLEYCLGENRSYVWVVGFTSFAVYVIPKRADIEEAARQFHKIVTVLDGAPGNLKLAEAQRRRRIQLGHSASVLSDMVLGPLSEEIEGKRLIIVSDGALQYVPFSALPRPSKARPNDIARMGPPLATEHEIVVLPSASTLSILRYTQADRKGFTKTVAVFADPVFAKNDERVERGSQVQPQGSALLVSAPANNTDQMTRSLRDVDPGKTGLLYLPRLSFTRREAQAIMAVTPPGQGLESLDFDANRTQLASPDLAQFRMVHIATHGLVDSTHPELSGLVLSLVDRHGNSQDGFLGLQDIYNLNLPVDLVVLSACETGLGREIQGEGLIGLTRGFMYAGATRVVASLWKADDAGTAELMTRFYRGIEQRGMRPAAALREAQVQMWKQKRWADPYYWAGFQIQGEWK